MSFHFQFDPPLCIPGKGGADVLGTTPLWEGVRPDTVQVIVYDKEKHVLADGIYRYVSGSDGLYRLESGTAYLPAESGSQNSTIH